ELDPAAGAGRWLAQRANRKQIAAQAARLLPDAILAIDRDSLREEVERGLIERLAALDLGQIIGASLEVMTRNQRHHAILDKALRRLEGRLADPAAMAAMRERVRAELPTLFRFFLADAYLLQRLLRASHALLTDIRHDPAHPIRAEFDRLIAEFLSRLKQSPEQRQKVDALKRELLASAELRAIVIEACERLIAFL